MATSLFPSTTTINPEFLEDAGGGYRDWTIKIPDETDDDRSKIFSNLELIERRRIQNRPALHYRNKPKRRMEEDLERRVSSADDKDDGVDATNSGEVDSSGYGHAIPGDVDFEASKGAAGVDSYDSGSVPGVDEDTSNPNDKRCRTPGHVRRTLSNASTTASTSIKTPSLLSGASTSTCASLRSPSLCNFYTSGEIPSLTDVNTCINAICSSAAGDEYIDWYNSRYVNENEADHDFLSILSPMEDFGFCKPQRNFYNTVTVTVDALFRTIFFWAESTSIIAPEQQGKFENYDALELVFRICTGRFLVWIQLLDVRTINGLTTKFQIIMAHLQKLSSSRARINDNQLDEHGSQQELQRFLNEIQEFLLSLKVDDLMTIPDTSWPVLAARILGNKGMRVKKMTFLRLLGAQEVQEFVDADIISYLAMVAPLLWLNDENYEAPTIMSVADGTIDLDGTGILREEGGFDIFSSGAYGGLSLRDRGTFIPDEKNLDGTVESRRLSTFLKRLEMHRDSGKFGILPLVGFCKAPGILEGVNPVYSIEEQPLDDMYITTLEEHLRSSLPLVEVKRVSLALGLAKAVLHLHLVGWTHGNLSPENVLLPREFRERQGIPQPYFRGLRVNSPWRRRIPIADIAQEHFSEDNGPARDIEALGWLLLEVYIWRELKPSKRRSTMRLADWSGNLVREKFALAFYSCVSGLAANEGLFASTTDPERSRTGLYWKVVRPLEECLAILGGKLTPFWTMDGVDGMDQRYQDAACATLNRAIDAVNSTCEDDKSSKPLKVPIQAIEDGQTIGASPGTTDDHRDTLGRASSIQRHKQKQVRVVSPQDDLPGKNRNPSTTRFGILSHFIPGRLDVMLSKPPIREPETTSANTGSEATTSQSPLSAPPVVQLHPEAQNFTTETLVDDRPPPIQQSQSPSKDIPKEIDSPSERELETAKQELELANQEPANQEPSNTSTSQSEKRMIYAVQASPEVLQAWHTSILPRLEFLLQRLSTTRTPIGPTTIALLGVGTSRETSRPTIVITCNSSAISLVRTYLKKKFTYDMDTFDLKVRKGTVRRSSSRRCRRRFASRSLSSGRYNSSSIAVNREYQQKPLSGASIGACRDGEDLPPGTFGGVIAVDGELYGMTVHHLLDPLSEEDYEDADEESDVLASIEGLRLDTGTNEWRADDEGDDEEGDEIEWQSDEDDEGYDDNISLFSETSSLESTSTDEDQDDFPDDESVSTTGDVLGFDPHHNEEIFITQPAIFDLPDDSAIVMDEIVDPLYEKHKLGTILASSGLRRVIKNGIKHEVDWALVKIEPNRLEHINTIRGGGKYCQGQVECEDLYPNGIVPITELGVNRVHASGRTTGLQTGEMSQCMGSLMLPGRASWSRSWHVIGNLGIPGDSGSWVVENTHGRVVGVVIARDDCNNFTYIAPMELLIDDIKETLGANEVGLPPRHLKREQTLDAPQPSRSSSKRRQLVDAISRSIVQGELESATASRKGNMNVSPATVPSFG